MSDSNDVKIYLSRDNQTDGPFTPADVAAMKVSGEFQKYIYIWESTGKGWAPIHSMPAPPPEPPVAAAPPTPPPAPTSLQSPVQTLPHGVEDPTIPTAPTVIMTSPPVVVAPPPMVAAPEPVAPPPAIEAPKPLPTSTPEFTVSHLSPPIELETPTRSVPTPSLPNSRPGAPRSAPSFSSATQAGTRVEKAIAAILHDNRNIVGGTIEMMIGQESLMRSPDHPDGFPPFRKGGQVTINLLDEASGKSENALAEIVDLKKGSGIWEFRLRWKAMPRLLS